MVVAFAGFRHSHINGLYEEAKKNENINIRYCYEQDEMARKEATNKLNIDFNVSSYNEILIDKEVEIIALGGVFAERGEMAIQALTAGKHVIADKPICTSLAELKKIRELSTQKGLKVSCMLDLRYFSGAIETRKFISEGKIGEIKNISFTGQHCLSYGIRPSWYFEEGKQGGTINDIAIHGVDLINYITGLKISEVCCAREWNSYAKEHKSFKDCAQFMAKLTNGAGVLADVSYSAPNVTYMLPTYWNFDFWGDKGLLNYNLSSNKITLHMSGATSPEELKYDSRPILHFAELLKEINGEETILKTEEVLNSSEQTLIIQQFAE